MGETAAFLVYAAVFRLAVIAAGVVAIVLGYALFVRGVMPHEGTEAGAEAVGVRLNVKNAAPGTCFALFGALIIAATLGGGRPELVMQQLRELGGSDAAPQPTRVIEIRGVGETDTVRPTIVVGESAGLERTRLRLRHEIEFLNRLPEVLRPDLRGAEREVVARHVRDIKLGLMAAVWAADWGDLDAFREWAEGGPAPPQTQAFHDARAFYEAGRGSTP